VGGFLCRGTCFTPIPCLSGRFPGRPDSQDLQKARDFAAAILDHVAGGSPGPMPESRSGTLKHGVGFYSLVGAVLNDTLMRLLMPKPKADADKCTECRWCVTACPTESIRLDPKPTIAGTCYRCYRCMTGCPQGAFSVKWGISNVIVWTLYNQLFERWFGDVRRGERVH